MNLFVLFILLAFYSYMLVQGKPFHQVQKDLVEHTVEVETGKKSKYSIDSELVVRMFGMLIVLISVVILEVIMICVGLLIDPNLVVSLAMLTYFVVTAIITSTISRKRNNINYMNEYQVDKMKAKVDQKHTVYQKINVLTWMAYFVYLAVIIIT